MIPKFRVWDKHRERMIEQNESVIWFDKFGVGMVEDKNYTVTEIIKFELLQSTGLKDKNGVEIYIGDILEWEMVMGFGWYENGKDVVIYDEKELKIKMSKRDDYSLNRVVGVGCKVVGNKFEHPHLLEEG